MGNYASRGFMCRDEVEDNNQVVWWGDYVKGQWRSEKSRELDSLGGLSRHPVTRGDSLTTKLQFLSGAVKKADALPESTEKSEAAKLDDVGFMLHTDRRAMERTVLPERSTAGAPFPPERSPSTSATSTPNSSNAPLIMPSPPLTPSPFPPVGKRNISNQRGSNSLPVIRKTHMQLEGEEGRALRTSVSSMPRLGENGEIFVHPRVAEWRIRCHKARRRAILVVLTCIRLQRGLIKPNRLRRIDSFSFYIPIILSNETTRFIEEQRKFASIKKEISHLKDTMGEILEERHTGLVSLNTYDSTDEDALFPDSNNPSKSASDQNAWPSAFRHRSASDSNVGIIEVIEGRELAKINSVPTPGRQLMVMGSSDSTMSLPPLREEDGLSVESSDAMPPVSFGQRVSIAKDLVMPDRDSNSSFTFPQIGPKPPGKPPLCRESHSGPSSPDRHSEPLNASSPTPPKPSRLTTIPAPPTLARNSTDSPRSGSAPLFAKRGGGKSESPVTGGTYPPLKKGPPLGPRHSIEDRGADRSSNQSLSSQNSSRVRFSSVDGISTRTSTSSTSSINSMASSSQPHKYTARPSPARGILLTETEKSVRARQKWKKVITDASNNTSHKPGQQSDPRAPRESDRLKTLTQYLETEVNSLQRSELILNMHVNRANGVWGEQRQWDLPRSMGAMEQQHFFEGESYAAYKAQLLAKLLRGEVAIQVMAAENSIALPGGKATDLWSTDPWNLVSGLRPEIMPKDRIRGLCMGGRMLTQLRCMVESFGGRDAARNLKVILHLHDGQELQAVSDLNQFGMFGLSRENLYICIQRRRRGYSWDAGTRCFERDPSGPLQSLGSGYSCMQLNWVAEAFTLNEDGSYQEVPGTMLEALAVKNIEWLISVQAQDLMLCGKDSVDLSMLAYTMYLRDRTKASMSLQVFQASSMQMAQVYDSVVMTIIPDGDVPRDQMRGRGIRPVCDLTFAEVSSSRMAKVLTQLRSKSNGAINVGLHRYIFHLPSLAKSLAEMSTFRPKLILNGELVYIRMEMSDLTSVNIHSIEHSSMCVAIKSRAGARPSLFTSAKEIGDLANLIKEQDKDIKFRHVLPGAAAAPVQQVQRPTLGQKIVVFVAENVVSPMAVDTVALMAQPGKDVVYLVTVVSTVSQQPAGHNLVSSYAMQLRKLNIETNMDIIVKGYAGMLDCLDSYVMASGATLVVMGSLCLTAANLNSMGSVTLSCMKRLNVPIMVVTVNSKNIKMAAQQGQRRPYLKTMLIVEPHARPMLQYVCGKCVDRRRGDQLLLAQVNATTPGRQLVNGQVSGVQRHTMQSFINLAQEMKTSISQQLLLDANDVEKTLQAATTNEYIHVIGVQVPLPGGSDSNSKRGQYSPIVSIIRGNRAATLVYK